MEKLIFTPFANHNIKNIIFDLGGVILNIDYNLTIQEFINLGITNFGELFTQANQVDIFDKLDKGNVSPSQFRDAIRDITGIPLSDYQIDKAWNAMLLDFPKSRLKLLGNIGKHYRTFLLSNTNAIHIDDYNKILYNTFGVENLSSFFEKEYYSFKINMRKPDSEVFEHIINENSLNPSETLFIDDSIQHVESAQRLGILAYHLNIPAGETIDKLFCVI